MSTYSPIVWTQQHRYLWTGRRDGKPIGIIERGARYTFTDAVGSEHHGFRTLEAAQNAAAELCSEPISEQSTRTESRVSPRVPF